MNRRQLLKRGLLGAAILSLAGLLAWPPRRRFAPEKTTYLSADAAAVLGAIAARVVPQGDARAIAARVDESLVLVHPAVRRDIDRLLRLFDNALLGLLLDARSRPFSALPPEAQDDVLIAWRDSRLLLRRTGYQALRKLCVNAHYGDRATHLALGYPGARPTGGLFYDDSKAGT